MFGQVKKKIDYGLSKVGQSAILDRACCGSISFAKISQTLLYINPLNVELNPNCHSLALLGANRILHVSRIRVNFLFLRDLAKFVKIYRDLK
jgi:hypothetical protein